MRLIARTLPRVRDERGFTMVMTITVIFCVTMLAIAALSAAQGDLEPGGHDKSRKIAHAAAEAGVQNYLFHLGEDADYWAKCTNVSAPHAVSNAWDGVSAANDTRRWMAVPDSGARYTIELLPANGTAACSTADPAGTMIDDETGTIKIRATGENVADGVRRSIIATFKQQSLLDYIYLTDKETRAPGLYGMNAPSRVTREKAGLRRDIVTWARQECDRYWGNDPGLGGRGLPFYDGQYQEASGAWNNDLAVGCNEPEFKAGDEVKGPMHTNDEILIDCGTPAPKFGDSYDDPIETSSLGQTPVYPANPRGGWRGCANREPFVNFDDTSPLRDAGQWKPRAAPLQLPLTNTRLLRHTAPAYQFAGTTKIVLNGTTMRVTGKRKATGSPALVDVQMAIPADGVVYVANDGSCPEYNSVDAYAQPGTCGNLELEGNYAANVTFTAENDIVVKSDLVRTTASSQFLLGLIAQNYIRVFHTVTDCVSTSPVICSYRRTTGDNRPACRDTLTTPHNVDIDAAMVALTGSFMVDNWFCGASLGPLRVLGAIAQKYRGPVNRDNNGVAGGHSGFDKNYTYDTRLKHRAPPHFLDPVSAQWRIQTFSEQVPAR
jgi:hypothetical protein